ncbi:MAG: hypothetical protein HY302_14945 [Opitutae bacterium]|nr:hypothetical protein [Opitutae bacterium]
MRPAPSSPALRSGRDAGRISRWLFSLLGAWGVLVTALIVSAQHPAAAPADPADSIAGPAIAVPRTPSATPPAKERNWIDQTRAEADRKSIGCLECHQKIEEMHSSPTVVLGCTDCHGGNPTSGLTMRKAHVAPRNPAFWESSANPSDASILLNHESAEFIQFVNPSDLRVADKACGLCHGAINQAVGHSMMNHGAMLWGAALYNNGGTPRKDARYGQAYGLDGAPLRLESPIPVTPEMTLKHGILPFLEPLPRFAFGQPSNLLRIFEQGGEKQIEIGNPNAFESPGRPARRLSERGLGTLNRIDPVYLNLQKTRLNDPLLGLMGTNNHAGDYRNSGCAACHVVYANDRSPSNSGWWSKYGHQGLSFSADPMISKKERGHPIKHQFTRSIPSSQCMSCHMHQGNLFVNPYLGYTWWDQESDGEFMYPKVQKNPTEAETLEANKLNPEAAAARGLWGDPEFLEKVAELNPQLKQTQFADYHGHGWIFRAVFKKDKVGNLLTLDDQVIDHADPAKFAKAVHLKDVHLARGMQCVDCHFTTDVHGNGLLYGEPRAATAIECIDCHGTIDRRPNLKTSGNSGRLENGQVLPNDLAQGTTPWGPRFYWQDKKLFQRSMMQADLVWEVPQTRDSIDPQSAHYNPLSAYAKTLRRDGTAWGSVPAAAPAVPGFVDHSANAPVNLDPHASLAHNNANVGCQICHTSWATSCFGCHIPMRANKKIEANKYEGTTTRNYSTYNPQVVRDDVFMLGKDATYKNQQLAVLRSSSAVIVGSENSNREWIYSQQQTVSAEGYSGQAFNPHFAHTTSSVGTTKSCTDCHLSTTGDNNAWMTQLLGFGTGTVNFFGRYAYVATGQHGFNAVVWTEREEPQAAYGSHLQHLAYPANYDEHVTKNAGLLKEAHEHPGKDIQDLILRGEYLYTANGPGGFEVFDVANIDHKAFSERITSAPVSPLGQRLWVKTKYATSITLPSTLGIDPLRLRLPENQEQPISLIYGFAYITDREEGLVSVMVGTLVDGNPANNFFTDKDVVRFNPDGLLTGATHSYMAGHRLYVTCTAGLIVVDLTDPFHPKIAGRAPAGSLKNPRRLALQFHYAFVTDDDGLKTFDLTDPLSPQPLPAATVPLAAAQGLYVARTYAYVANGPEGLAIIDIKHPTAPKLSTMFNAGGALTDTRAVQIGSINASMFALVADGKNGLRVLQMISPENVPGHMGFSPPPNPQLIATYPTHGEAIAVSRGLDRDRVVDETGNQTVVFGRRGARPFKENEFNQFVRHDGGKGDIYRVEDLRVREGVLQTKDGRAVQPTETFVPDPVVPVAPPRRDRLERRPPE